MAQHSDEGIVAVEQIALGGRRKNKNLHLLEERPVLLLRGTALGSVPNHMNGRPLFSSLIYIRRGRSNRKSSERIQPFVKAVFGSTAIRTIRPSEIIFGQHCAAYLAYHLGLRFPDAAQQRWVRFQNAEVRVVK